jgi:hypothetical protein
MVSKKQNRVSSRGRFKANSSMFELLKYSPATLKIRLNAIVKEGDRLEKSKRSGVITTLDYHNRVAGLREVYDLTARALLHKRNFKSEMRKFPINLKG